MLKRIFDVIATATGLIFISPVLVVLCYFVRKNMGSPIFFKQKRPGLHGRPFYMYKFRTMTNTCDCDGCLLPDCDRVTSFGKFLRSTSLDELPELFNVLKGEMSLVGPRPLLMEYMDYYTEEEMVRHTVRPGITGLAQVSGRNATSWDKRLAYDVEYVKNQSLWLDLKIIFKTLHQVFRREGVVVVPSELYQKLSDERSGK